MDVLSSTIGFLNHWGPAFCNFAASMLVQSSILVGLLLIVDLCLRGRVCARLRYGMWLLVLVKLALPPSLALPTGIGYWLGSYWPAALVVSQPPAPTVSVPVGYVEPSRGIIGIPAGGAEIAGAGNQVVSLQWEGLVLLGWSAGVLLLLALVMRRVAFVRRSLHLSRPAQRWMVALLEECRANLGVTEQVTLRLSEGMCTPGVCGFARPVILLPASLPPELGPAGLRTILTHELAHVKRRDSWISLAQIALQVAYFWHPLVWVANRKLRHVRELAVDEMVLATLKTQAQCYTYTLIGIAEMALRKPALSLRLIGIAESRKALERRIAHMLNRRVSRRPAPGLSGLLIIMAIGALLVPMGPGRTVARAEPDLAQSVPELPQGITELFQLSLEDILAISGEPRHIFYGDQTYTRDNLPETYYMVYEDLSFHMHEGCVTGITLLSPGHVFGNGVRVGDSEAKVKQAFGPGYALRETEFKDFLTYEHLDLSFEIKKSDRSVMEINIGLDYGDPAHLQACARADEFVAQLPQRIARLDIDSADLGQVIATFGEPVKYVWGPNRLSPDQLPDRFVAVYPRGFHVFMADDHIVELRHEYGSAYVFEGKLRVGSTLEEALELLGSPVKTVQGEQINWSESQNVLFKDIDGRKGHCYYHRPDRKVRLWFGNYKVAAIYMTRSDYGEDRSEPSDPEFVRLLPERIAGLNIDSADLGQVIATFGEPVKYVWGPKRLSPDQLPDRFIAVYPGGFRVFMMNGRIVELRHEHSSAYVFEGKLRVGSTLEEALELLGPPVKTVQGEEINWPESENVLFKDIDGRKGHCYYHRPDRQVRLWFGDYKVAAIYMTRSDY